MSEGDELGEGPQLMPQDGLERWASPRTEGRVEDESGVLFKIIHTRKGYKTPNGELELTEISNDACLEDARFFQSS